jgi:hypothetical protein
MALLAYGVGHNAVLATITGDAISDHYLADKVSHKISLAFSLSAVGRHGSSDANWIDAGSSYEFRLYNSDHSKLLEKALVTKPTPWRCGERRSPSYLYSIATSRETQLFYSAFGRMRDEKHHRRKPVS